MGGEGTAWLFSSTCVAEIKVTLPLSEIFSVTVTREASKNLATCWYWVHRGDSSTLPPQLTIDCWLPAQ